MGKSDLQAAKQNWLKRINNARSAGLPDSSFTGLMQRDFASVNQGHTPMADKEVYDAIAATTGISPIKDPEKGTSPLDIVGNIPSDIQNIVGSFIPGIVEYATTLPQQMKDLVGEIKQDPATQQKLDLEGAGQGWDWGDFFRNLPKTPVLGPLVPGIGTIARLTTPEGRKELERAPVSTAIDVGATLAVMGKAGAFGEPLSWAAESDMPHWPMTEESKALLEDKLKPLDKAAQAQTYSDLYSQQPPQPQQPAPTVLNALRQGQPYKALGRAALAGVSDLPIVGQRINRETLRSTFLNMGAHPELVNLVARPYSEIRNKLTIRMVDFAKSNIVRPILELSKEDQALLSRVLTETASEEDKVAYAARTDLQQIGQTTRQWMADMAKQNPDLVTVKAPWDRSYVYSKGSPVAKTWDQANRLQDEVRTAEEVMNQNLDLAKQRAAKYGNDHRLTQAAVKETRKSIATYQKKLKASEEAGHTYLETLRSNAPASFYARLSQDVRSRASTLATAVSQHTGIDLADALSRIQNSVDIADLAQSVGPEEAQRIMTEVELTWSTLAKGGLDPVFLPNTAASRVSHIGAPTVITDARYAKAHVSKATSFNLSRSVHDVAVGLQEYKRQALTEAGTRAFVDNVLRPLSKTSTDIHDSIRRAAVNGGPSSFSADIQQHIIEETDRNYETFHPEKFGLGKYFTTPEGGELLLPKGVAKSLRYLGMDDRGGPLMEAWDKTMGVWRFSLLSTPRHISHVLLGGMMMGLLQDPKFVVHLGDAIKIIRGHDETLIAKFGRNMHDFSPDQIVNFAGAKTWGRLLTAATGSVKWLNRMEENATLMYKIATMLSREASGATREEAIGLANKFFVDMNSLTPFERVTMRKIFPFYGFTRHLFRYLMTYPADHPVRASILTNLANQANTDWNTGLPQSLHFMFFLGAPDSNGNVGAVDYRSIDPFRSFYNDFTLAGLTSQANPAIQFGLQQAGVNVLSATPELYPNTHYDPVSGTMVADRPGNVGLQALEAFVPPTQAIDALYGMSDMYRNLKITDPQAYKHRIYSSLGIPFAPEEINVPLKVEAAQMKRYKDSQTAIDKAVQTGDFSDAKRYAAAPVPSDLQPYFGRATYASVGAIEAVYRGLQARLAAAGLGGTSLHAALPKPKRTRTR